jgi:hypothetical protein
MANEIVCYVEVPRAAVHDCTLSIQWYVKGSVWNGVATTVKKDGAVTSAHIDALVANIRAEYPDFDGFGSVLFVECFLGWLETHPASGDRLRSGKSPFNETSEVKVNPISRAIIVERIKAILA